MDISFCFGCLLSRGMVCNGLTTDTRRPPRNLFGQVGGTGSCVCDSTVSLRSLPTVRPFTPFVSPTVLPPSRSSFSFTFSPLSQPPTPARVTSPTLLRVSLLSSPRPLGHVPEETTPSSPEERLRRSSVAPPRLHLRHTFVLRHTTSLSLSSSRSWNTQ